jgi:hypothetical protein
MRFLTPLALCLAVLSLLAGSRQARAQESKRAAIGAGFGTASDRAAAYGATSSGLCGLAYTGAPTCGRGVTLAASAGYGATFLRGRHDRALGSLALAVVPLDWLALSLELTGRIDSHPRDALGKSVTGTGDPFLRARLGRKLGKAGFSLGGELGLWLPGRDAPSFRADALTPEFKLLLALQRGRLSLLGLLGARIDQSSASAPDLTRLREVDRVTLGLSDSHALLLGLGLGYLVAPRLSLFAELSADLLLGAKAPALSESPLRASAGGRCFVVDGVQLELSLHGSLSQRPRLAAGDPLVPIEPRIAVLFGVRATFGAPKPKPATQAAAVLLPPSEPAHLASLSGVLTDPTGAPLPEVRVKLLANDGLLETISDAQGRYSFEQLHPGKAELRADASGFKSANWQVEIKGADIQLPPRALEPGESTGVLRCLVRSFESAALKAEVSVRDARGRRVASGNTDSAGSVEFSLSPGEYRVMIEAAGYRGQRSQVRVDANEVAILNVDMRTIE